MLSGGGGGVMEIVCNLSQLSGEGTDVTHDNRSATHQSSEIVKDKARVDLLMIRTETRQVK
jgi:hypothetical protein